MTLVDLEWLKHTLAEKIFTECTRKL